MKEHVLEHLTPEDPLMAIAWRDGLRWAVGEPEVLARFRADTENHWLPGVTGLERQIDEATGAAESFVVEFAEWFNAQIWGDITRPPTTRESVS